MPPVKPGPSPDQLITVTYQGKTQVMKLSELPPTTPEELEAMLGAGKDLWASDEELDEFLADIRRAHGKEV
jgi:hypothetical protein